MFGRIRAGIRAPRLRQALGEQVRSAPGRMTTRPSLWPQTRPEVLETPPFVRERARQQSHNLLLCRLLIIYAFKPINSDWGPYGPHGN